jgi:hypothetical protein
MTEQQILDLIRSLPEADQHIHTQPDGVHVTNEWLVGNFAGTAFVAETEIEAARKLIAYLDRHIGHDSVVGRAVTESGYPNAEKMREYLLTSEMETYT